MPGMPDATTGADRAPAVVLAVLAGAIPIFFYWVLAAYLLVWSRLHTRPAGEA